MKVYFSHAFGDKKENFDHLDKAMRHLMDGYGHIMEELDITPVSPVHSFSFAYKQYSYEYGMKMCIDLLNQCSLMVTFPGFDNSRGVEWEKAHCEANGIKVINIKQFEEMMDDMFELKKLNGIF